MTLLGKKSNEKIVKPSAGVNVPLVVPFYQLLPYQDLILNITKVLSLRNPIGLSILLSSLSLFFVAYYIIAPSFVTSASFLGIVFVWGDFGLHLLRSRVSTESLTKDERMTEIYRDYVYVATYADSIKNTILRYRQQNEYIFVGGATVLLILIAYIGKSFSNILLIWRNGNQANSV